MLLYPIGGMRQQYLLRGHRFVRGKLHHYLMLEYMRVQLPGRANRREQLSQLRDLVLHECMW